MSHVVAAGDPMAARACKNDTEICIEGRRGRRGWRGRTEGTAEAELTTTTLVETTIETTN